MPQQRRAQLTRRAIVLAAAQEFDRAGYDATPLSAVLSRSGVTKGAFYFHFPSKEALAQVLVRVQRRRWPKLHQDWLSRDVDPLSAVVGLIGEAARLLEHDVVIRAGTRLARHAIVGDTGASSVPDWEKVLTQLLRRSSARGLLRPEVDPSEVARVLHAAMVGSCVLGLERGRSPGVEARMEEMWRVTLPGIASPEWLHGQRRGH